jgi:hypothetical protein
MFRRFYAAALTNVADIGRVTGIASSTMTPAADAVIFQRYTGRRF